MCSLYGTTTPSVTTHNLPVMNEVEEEKEEVEKVVVGMQRCPLQEWSWWWCLAIWCWINFPLVCINSGQENSLLLVYNFFLSLLHTHTHTCKKVDFLCLFVYCCLLTCLCASVLFTFILLVMTQGLVQQSQGGGIQRSQIHLTTQLLPFSVYYPATGKTRWNNIRQPIPHSLRNRHFYLKEM